MLAHLKRFFFAALLSALAGSALVGWFSPQIISWYFTPPANMVLSCQSAVEWGVYTYRKVVLFGGAIGLVVGLSLYIAYRSHRAHRQARQLAQAAQAAK